MRVWFVPLVLACAAMSWTGESHLNVSSGSLNGSVVILNRASGDGGKFVRSVMRLKKDDGQIVKIIQESTFDKSGQPIRKSQTTQVVGWSGEQSVVVDFDQDGAKVKAKMGKQALETNVPYPSGKSVKAVSEFWIYRDKVKPGTKATYYRFDLGSQSWVETNCSYLGKKKVRVGSKTLNLHYMKLGEVTNYTDDLGDPVRVETASIRMQKN